jgi:hypothetical protein
MGQLDDKTQAGLLLSVGTRKRWRALDPIESAKQIELMTRKTSIPQIAGKLAVSAETVREFLSLLSLPEEIQELVRTRKIGIDAGYRLSLINNSKDQQAIAKAIVGDEKLKTKEIRGIIQSLKKRNPEMPISECIAIAVKYRPIIEEENVIITGIEKSTFRHLKEISENSRISLDDLIKEIATVAVQVPEGLKLAKCIDSTLLLAVTKEGYSAFMSKAKELMIKPDELMETLAKERLRRGETVELAGEPGVNKP